MEIIFTLPSSALFSFKFCIWSETLVRWNLVFCIKFLISHSGAWFEAFTKIRQFMYQKYYAISRWRAWACGMQWRNWASPLEPGLLKLHACPLNFLRRELCCLSKQHLFIRTVTQFLELDFAVTFKWQITSVSCWVSSRMPLQVTVESSV